ncbi:MAG: dGTPase [Oceanotoga sp.]|uniref:deoxyguanosinetriphosphate triphosphohydrolase family protein n=1 Tax=Oceanotoga sp. TaxID=2108366 RepID=UPI0026547AE3|nr:HD domain-containing protein [Oceanotoga sp.]MDN5343653.1 dGTPase [Oceanotoga sp.]
MKNPLDDDMKNPLDDDIYKRRIIKREEDNRGPYFRDQTAIIHSMSFRRLKNKTQVFFSPQNDHICTRIEHSLHVSTIAAFICKELGLDVNLAQAIALGHDLGHAPFGHTGEKKLNELAKGIGGFIHEVHSLRVVDKLDRSGKGLNLTYAVRDGIISHCGEDFTKSISPVKEEKVLEEIRDRSSLPTTYEGCVVRMADKISYLGRDIEDAITAQLIKEEDIPSEVREKLGKKNGEIIDSFVTDLIDWSHKNGEIGFSDEKFKLMNDLKKFNYKNIYEHNRLKTYITHAEQIIEIIFNHLVTILRENGLKYDKYNNSDIPLDRRFGNYLCKMRELYTKEGQTLPKQIVLDYVSGMTDQYALQCAKEIIFPEPINFDRAEVYFKEDYPE